MTPPTAPEHPARRRNGPAGAWSLWVVIPLDALGLYFALAALKILPREWPTPTQSAWVALGSAIALFAIARAIALLALGRLLRWRIASDAWSRSASARRRVAR